MGVPSWVMAVSDVVAGYPEQALAETGPGINDG